MMNDQQLSDLRNLLIAAGNDLEALYGEGGVWSDDLALILSSFSTARCALDKMLFVIRESQREADEVAKYPEELRELMEGDSFEGLAQYYMGISAENERVMDEREDLLERIAALEAANRLRATT